MCRKTDLYRRLFTPVDIASIGVFRIVFGLLLVYQVGKYFDRGWIDVMLVGQRVHFTYQFFEWVKPWPGNGMAWHFAAMGVAALGIAVGAAYRASAAVFCLLFTHVLLIDKARFLNHYYLVALIALLLVFIPAHGVWSVDARLRPQLRRETVPWWSLAILRFQMGLVYAYGGINKLNADWLQGEPVRHWLSVYKDVPVIGAPLASEAGVAFISYGGIVFDLAITPLLLWRRTRPWAFVVAAMFHVTNALIFNIGIFPWLALAATSLFFSPSWPRRWLGQRPRSQPVPVFVPRRGQPLAAALLAAFVAWQLLFPLRRFAYAGPSGWHMQAVEFSWMMMHRHADGFTRFFVRSKATGQVFGINTEAYLNPIQDQMLMHPDGILQFAHILAREFRESGQGDVDVRAVAELSLNGRPRVQLIDPEVDLAAEERRVAPYPWILPLTEPLPPHRRFWRQD